MAQSRGGAVRLGSRLSARAAYHVAIFLLSWLGAAPGSCGKSKGSGSKGVPSSKFYIQRYMPHHRPAQACNEKTIDNPPPQFMIVSCAKCGSTALYHKVCSHPQITCKAKDKESNWFRRHGVSGSYKSPAHAYASYLSDSYAPIHHGDPTTGGGGDITFEASIWYYKDKQAKQGIPAVLPCSKKVWLLRNPLSRVRSDYFHQLTTVPWWKLSDRRLRNRDKAKPFTLEQLLTMEVQILEKCQHTVNSGLTSDGHSAFLVCYGQNNKPRPDGMNKMTWLVYGLYAHHLQEWLTTTPMSKMHFIDYEDIKAANPAMLNNLTASLGLEPFPPSELTRIKERQRYGINTHATQAGHAKMAALSPALVHRLKAALEPHVQLLYSLIGRDLAWDLGRQD